MAVDLGALPRFYDTGIGVFGYCITCTPAYSPKLSARRSTWRVDGVPKRAARRRRGRTFFELGTALRIPAP